MDRINKGTVQVFTFKEGLLSPLAHDLRLDLKRFEVELDGERVKGRFWPATLTVDGVMKGNQLDPDGLKDSHKREIKDNITGKILKTADHPLITFNGRRQAVGLEAWKVEGELEILGRLASVAFSARLDGGAIKGEVELQQTRWGIAPFKAMAGAIKLKDTLKLVFSLDAP